MQSKYPISLLYLNILETCLNRCSIQSISCRSYILALINGITDKQKPTGKNHLITEFKQNNITLVCSKTCASRSVCIRTRQLVEWIRPNNNKTQDILLPITFTIKARAKAVWLMFAAILVTLSWVTPCCTHIAPSHPVLIVLLLTC